MVLKVAIPGKIQFKMVQRNPKFLMNGQEIGRASCRERV